MDTLHALVMIFAFLTNILAAATPIPNFPKAKPGCFDSCGNISIPYPFGMDSDNCYENYDFSVFCNETYNPPKLFIQDTTIEITEISLDGQLTVMQFIAVDCYSQNGTQISSNNPYIYLQASVTINNTANKFTIIGCDTYGYIYGRWNNDREYETRCSATCAGLPDLAENSCGGMGCCQITSIPKDVWRVELSLESFHNYTHISNFSNCSYSFLAKEDAFTFHPDYLTNPWNIEKLPMVADWAIGNGTCEAARENSSSYACRSQNSECYKPDNGHGYRCLCNKGYQGNPYLHDGCQDVDECTDYMLNVCTIGCTNTPGGFNCTSCPLGYRGNGIGRYGCQDIDECSENLDNCSIQCQNNNGSFSCICPNGYRGNGVGKNGCILDNSNVYKRVAGGASVGIILLLFVTCFSYYEFKRRKSNKMKQEFFLQNGGMLLQQKLSKRERSPDMAKIYSATELQKATNNFHKSMIIGQGGHGTVYKGLLENEMIVAIKKSKEVIQSEIQQFINEVFVLSQVNHPNVVKLLGCCLETAAPLLVYEFISNGTLFDHIRNERLKRSLDWNIRLKIAVETANVLSYLHSATSTPIIHRDVKSANILLDHNFTTKVSDFGASRLVPIDQTQLSTMVQGTFGYLDPEYMQTNQLTEKSDVYSFGVVLIELLTGMKPLSYDRPEEDRNLANFFLRMLKQKRLFEIIDENIVSEWNRELIIEVAMLAQRCIKVYGEDRPTMKEVAIELDGVKLSGKHSWVNIENNAEENEYLLGEAKSSGFNGYSASMGYDNSIKDHIVLLPMSGGR